MTFVTFFVCSNLKIITLLDNYYFNRPLCLKLILETVLNEIVQATDFGDCLLIEIIQKIDFEYCLLLGIVQTTNFGNHLLIGIV